MLDGSLSLVIPAHNEVENIGPILRQCAGTLPRLAPAFEIVLVDDGSTDGTVAAAEEALGAEVARLRVVRHERKSGYGVTVLDGLNAATGDYIAFMDGDGQFNVEDLGTLTGLMVTADFATGWRQKRADPWFRLFVAGVFNVLVRLLYGVRYRDVDCGLKVMRRRVLENASPLLARSALLNTELYFKTARNGFRIAQAPVPHYPRLKGVRSGGRLIPILRAVRDLVRLRLRLAREWHPRLASEPAPASQS
jgi:glycosyltransferase involved in cell wall biosynthesis